MIKFTNILKEESSNKEFEYLDTPTNRRLLNVVNKQIPERVRVSHTYFVNAPTTMDMSDITRPIQIFLRDSLFITESKHRGQLIWLISLNGNIDYLNGDMITDYKGYLYEMGYYSGVDSEWESRQEECYECDGYGTVPDECDMCNGNGEVEDDVTEEGEPIMITCPECEGSGEMDSDCNECGGSGETTEEYEEFTVELYEMIFLSKENIPYPSTLAKPVYQEREDGSKKRVDALPFPVFMEEYRKKIIIISQFFVDDIREEYESHVEDEGDNIDEFRKRDIDDYRSLTTLFSALGGR